MSNQFSERLCDICGQRPAAMQVLWSDGFNRSTGAICESCARSMVADAGGLVGAAPRGPRRPQAVQDRQKEAARQSKTPALDAFGRDLTGEARAGHIDPVIGRAEEIEQTVEILARRRKNNAVLIGEAGVGKTAIVEGLALRIVEGDVPETLRETRVVALDLAGMLAGAQYRGQFEQRLQAVLAEAAKPENRVLLFIDELHTVLGAGAAEGAMDAANMLKPRLARGELRIVGATTLDEYRSIERDAALARRFSAVFVEEPSVEEAVEILRGLRGAYEQHHGCAIADEALIAAARLADRYITEYRLPDKAIDLIDQAAARLALRPGAGQDNELARVRADLEEARAHKQAAVDAEEYEAAGELKKREDALEARLRELEDAARNADDRSENPRVDEADIAAVVARRTGIPVGELMAGELERLQTLEQELHERVIGQEAAVEAVADTVRRARVGLAEGDKPIGTFLFLGPTGVGKTELVKALAERLFSSEDALVRVDMSEYREPHTVARLIGSPPGYVGYGEGGQLTEPVRRRPYSVVLLDEVEKAHPDVWNVLLQLMDDGRLTDGEGRTVDFSNTVLVMTSNLGAGKAKRPLGFTADESGTGHDGGRMLAAAKAAFLPEFINRIDEIVTFEPLTHEQIERIAALTCGRIGERLAEERGIELTVEPALLTRLAREGFDEELGARPLKRHLRRTLEKELTRALLAGELGDGDRVTARDEAGAIRLDVERDAIAA